MYAHVQMMSEPENVARPRASKIPRPDVKNKGVHIFKIIDTILNLFVQMVHDLGD